MSMFVEFPIFLPLSCNDLYASYDQGKLIFFSFVSEANCSHLSLMKTDLYAIYDRRKLIFSFVS